MWMFPPEHRVGRREEGAVVALAGLAAANGGLAMLKARAHTQQAKQVGSLLTPKQRAVFWPASFGLDFPSRQHAVAELLHLHLLAVDGIKLSVSNYGTCLQDACVLYQWFGPGRYVGIAGLQRASSPAIPGPAQRWWEHWLHWARPHLKGANLKKYCLLHRSAADGLGFLVSRAGPSLLMRAAESLEIRCHQPSANACKPKKSLACHERSCSRPPRSLRGYRTEHVREGTFESARAAAFNSHVPQLEASALVGMGFHAAHKHVLQVQLLKTETFGPLNIFSPRQRRLALYFLVSSREPLVWERLDKQWKSSCAAVQAVEKSSILPSASEADPGAAAHRPCPRRERVAAYFWDHSESAPQRMCQLCVEPSGR